MSDWEDFLALDNFRLAWERILRSSHYHNKDRLGLRVYAANVEANLEDLIGRVREDIYKSSPAEEFYIPKRSGGVRSLPFLCIEDRIVYQAITNIVADKSRSSFEAVVRGHVFAHLAGKPNDVFMLRQWRGAKGQYRRFLNRFRQLLQRGYRWVVESDIAAYYDSVDHELLTNILQREYLDSNELGDLLKKCLRIWMPHKSGFELSNGLPQGYEASDYLATLFLLPVDEQLILQSGDYHYIRYVDDFRILAEDKSTVEKALVELDVALKKQALILKEAKTSIREVADINRGMYQLARKLSMLSVMERRETLGGRVGREAVFLFHRSWRALTDGEGDEHTETRLIFAMNRMLPIESTRRIALCMLRDMPWRSRDITSYLSKFKGDAQVIQGISKELRDHKAYQWHLANCMRALSEISNADSYRRICQAWISNEQLPWYQRLAAVESLRGDSQSYSFLLLRYRQERNHLVRREILMTAMLAASEDDQKALVIRSGMKDKHPQIIAAAVWLFLEFPGCGVSEVEFGTEMGVHRKMIPALSGGDLQSACFIKSTLSDMFGVDIPHDLDLRLVLDSVYDHAVDHLRRAKRYYYTDPDIFVTSLDNFNQVVAITVSEVLEGQNIPRDQYGNILKSLKNSHGIIAVNFIKCHELRSRSRGPHAYAKSLGTWSQNVTHPEKERLVRDISAAYQEFIDACAKISS